MSHRPVLHPLLFGLFPLLTLYTHNQAELVLADLWGPLLLSIGLMALLWAVSGGLLRSLRRGALWASCVVAFLFLYVPVLSPLLMPILGRHRYMLLVWAVLLVACLVILSRKPRDLRVATALLNNIALVMCLLPLGRLVFYEINGRTNAQEVLQTLFADEQPLPRELPLGYAPDIYYVVPDRYGGSDVLASLGYDNSTFLDRLREMGFFVARQGRANYPTTPLSLASALNMQYLQRTGELVGSQTKDSSVTFGLIKDNRVQRLLRGRGYRYIHMGGRWTATRHSPFADENVSYDFPLSEFNMEWVLSTAAAPLLYSRISTDALHRAQVLYRFEALKDVVRQAGPKFVFLHVLVPHTPYVFDGDGSEVSPEELEEWGEHEAYKRQVTWINKRLLESFELILAASERPPVIVLQADEGPHFENTFDDRMSPETIRTKASILNAIHVPGVARSDPPDDLTPVNNFRFVLQHAFGADYPPLENRTYWFEDPLRPYDNVDVTDTARGKP